MAPATAARGSARLSFCLTPVTILLLIASPWGAARAGAPLAEPPSDAQPSGRSARSAAQRFLQLISSYDAADDDARALRALFSAPSSRRERVRVSGLPVLLLPVALQDARQFDEYSVRPPRRRTSTEDDSGEEDERPPRRGLWDRDEAPAAWRPARRQDEAPAAWRPAQRSPYREPEYAADHAFPEYRDKPSVTPVESSQRLVEMFRAQAPTGDTAPPAIVQSEFDSSERVLLPDDDELDEDEWAPPARTRRALPPGGAAQRGGDAAQRGGDSAQRGRSAPPRPRLAHPLKLRAVLTVPRAGYSETYTAWWDPNSGDSRVHFQDGSAVTFRKMLPNGLVQKVEMHVDRASGRTLRRCATSVSVAGAADRLHPALPDLQLFTFAGHWDGAERWVFVAEEAARGEALAARHELLLLRDGDDSALPLRYSVAVNSSLLGADCDGYRHDYLDARYHNRGPDFFRADLDELCDEVRQLNASSAEALARLEPLREFTLPRRDPRYEAVLERFKTQNERQYVDDAEEAVRKNVVMQSSRFTASGNRAGATFQLGLNFLADRLDGELQGLRGVAHDDARSRAERFPHPRRALAALEPRLPAAFDWRAQGGVTPVRYQGTSCASCWAFATAGAVEGALFRRSGRLTPLSEQQLVDCAHAFGGNGCKGTWPSRAYDYIQARGLAALGDYTPYKEKVESCREEAVAPAARISGHVNVTKYSVPALKVAIKQHGPAVVIVDSSPKSFTLYNKGVLYDDRCSKKSAKHAVLAVGWGQEKGEPYFILKNSWSEVWGERGYIRVQARANTCGVLTHPSYPRLEDTDVLQD